MRRLLFISMLVFGKLTQETSAAETMARTPYIHDFDRGHGGWFADRGYALRIWDGIAHCYSPWFLDPNHAPPGAGYLHLVLWIYTDRQWYQSDKPWAAQLPYRESSFADQGKSRDLRNARLTVRLRGDVDLKGAHLLVHVQAKTSKTMANLALTGQPITVTENWSDQSVVLANDPKQWTCLGARRSLTDKYGCDDLDTVLSDVNYDLILILFPVQVRPAIAGVTDPDALVAGVDYPVNPSLLPKGLIQFKSIRIDYPENDPLARRGKSREQKSRE